jgi:hypothetical protein
MFALPSPWQKIGLALVALSVFLLVVAYPIILWLIRKTNIAADIAAEPGLTIRSVASVPEPGPAALH